MVDADTVLEWRSEKLLQSTMPSYSVHQPSALGVYAFEMTQDHGDIPVISGEEERVDVYKIVNLQLGSVRTNLMDPPDTSTSGRHR